MLMVLQIYKDKTKLTINVFQYQESQNVIIQNIIIEAIFTNYLMNIKINIKDCDCQPAVITRKQMSQVQFKKKNMLYAAPTKDKKQTNQQITTKKTNNAASLKNTQYNQQVQQNRNVSFQQAERKLVQDLSQISKNQMTTDMIQNNNTILQRQNQILEFNQRTLHNLVSNSKDNSNQSDNQMRNRELKRIFEESADKIARQVKQIKKMRDQILQAGQQFKRSLTQGSRNPNLNNPNAKGPAQIGQMNSNLKNLVQLSKNHIQGLQNLQGIKSLQNFNIQAYTQAINQLKRQIIQYQKQSETIQRQLKIRSSKLQKMQIQPNFQQQLLQPYEQYLQKKADGIDLHVISKKVYQKLGVFDYGKFQQDVSMATNQVKDQMNDFFIICKQYRIDVPEIKIDKKELKMLDLKLPSVLDQFKASKGIMFKQQKTQEQKAAAQQPNKKNNVLMKGTSKEVSSLPKKVTKKSSPHQEQQLGTIYTKPQDYSKNVKFTKTDQKQYKTVLQTKQQQQKKQVIRNIKKPNKDDDFEKYLENRAKQQLATIYEQKRKKLEQMQRQLYDKSKQQLPQYQLTLNVKNKVSPKKDKVKSIEQQRDQYEDEYFEEEQAQIKHDKKGWLNKQLNKEREQIKSVGTQVLRQKLKNLFSKSPNLNQHAHQNRLIGQHINMHQNGQNQLGQMNSIAQGFMNMINNTLTQVNTQLSQSIQKKIQNRSLSIQKRGQFQRKSPNRIVIPKLQQFRAPPVFNMQMVSQPAYRAEEKKPQKKIIAKNYEHLRVREKQSDLQISSISYDDD